MTTRYTLLLLFLCSAFGLYAQDDLMKMLEAETAETTTPVIQTFNGSRIVNGHSVETRSSGELEFLIMHRFSRINSGAYNLFGLDQAYIRLGLEYGITDYISIGAGRSSFDKSFDGYIKYKLLEQQDKGMPLTLTVFAGMAIKTSPQRSSAPEITLNERLAYVAQLLLARKFGPRLSVQLMPSVVHINSVDHQNDAHTLFATGIGGRYKVSKRIALTAEYYLRHNPLENATLTNPLAIGVDIQTGGHIFQLHFTNSWGMMERAIIAETSGTYFDGDINFGFNISRNFQLNKKKKMKTW